MLQEQLKDVVSRISSIFVNTINDPFKLKSIFRLQQSSNVRTFMDV